MLLRQINPPWGGFHPEPPPRQEVAHLTGGTGNGALLGDTLLARGPDDHAMLREVLLGGVFLGVSVLIDP